MIKYKSLSDGIDGKKYYQMRYRETESLRKMKFNLFSLPSCRIILLFHIEISRQHLIEQKYDMR